VVGHNSLIIGPLPRTGYQLLQGVNPKGSRKEPTLSSRDEKGGEHWSAKSSSNVDGRAGFFHLNRWKIF